jgi:hypothetical protein
VDGRARTEGPYGGIEVIRAGGSDLDTVLSILEEATLWLVRRGIDQWELGSFSRWRISNRIGHGEMYLARLAGQTFGTFALQWSDEKVSGATYRGMPVTFTAWRSGAVSPAGGWDESFCGGPKNMRPRRGQKLSPSRLQGG